MHPSRKFGGKSGIVPDFSPTALCALTAPATPEEVRQEAVTRAEAGEKITARDMPGLR